MVKLGSRYGRIYDEKSDEEGHVIVRTFPDGNLRDAPESEVLLLSEEEASDFHQLLWLDWARLRERSTRQHQELRRLNQREHYMNAGAAAFYLKNVVGKRLTSGEIGTVVAEVKEQLG